MDLEKSFSSNTSKAFSVNQKDPWKQNNTLHFSMNNNSAGLGKANIFRFA